MRRKDGDKEGGREQGWLFSYVGLVEVEIKVFL